MKDYFNPTPLLTSDLKAHLGQFGVVEEIYMYKNHFGKPKGYGFCDFFESSSKLNLINQKFSLLDNG